MDPLKRSYSEIPLTPKHQLHRNTSTAVLNDDPMLINNNDFLSTPTTITPNLLTMRPSYSTPGFDSSLSYLNFDDPINNILNNFDNIDNENDSNLTESYLTTPGPNLTTPTRSPLPTNNNTPFINQNNSNVSSFINQNENTPFIDQNVNTTLSQNNNNESQTNNLNSHLTFSQNSCFSPDSTFNPSVTKYGSTKYSTNTRFPPAFFETPYDPLKVTSSPTSSTNISKPSLQPAVLLKSPLSNFSSSKSYSSKSLKSPIRRRNRINSLTSNSAIYYNHNHHSSVQRHSQNYSNSPITSTPNSNNYSIGSPVQHKRHSQNQQTPINEPLSVSSSISSSSLSSTTSQQSSNGVNPFYTPSFPCTPKRISKPNVRSKRNHSISSSINPLVVASNQSGQNHVLPSQAEIESPLSIARARVLSRHSSSSSAHSVIAPSLVHSRSTSTASDWHSDDEFSPRMACSTSCNGYLQQHNKHFASHFQDGIGIGIGFSSIPSTTNPNHSKRFSGDHMLNYKYQPSFIEQQNDNKNLKHLSNSSSNFAYSPLGIGFSEFDENEETEENSQDNVPFLNPPNQSFANDYSFSPDSTHTLTEFSQSSPNASKSITNNNNEEYNQQDNEGEGDDTFVGIKSSAAAAANFALKAHEFGENYDNHSNNNQEYTYLNNDNNHNHNYNSISKSHSNVHDHGSDTSMTYSNQMSTLPTAVQEKFYNNDYYRTNINDTTNNLRYININNTDTNNNNSNDNTKNSINNNTNTNNNINNNELDFFINKNNISITNNRPGRPSLRHSMSIPSIPTSELSKVAEMYTPNISAYNIGMGMDINGIHGRHRGPIISMNGMSARGFMLDDEEKPHECLTCHKRFKRLEHLRRHVRTHTDERPFICDIPGCGRRFGRSDNLRAHKKTHMKKDGRNGYVEGLVVK